jgi:hypothetical protein
VQARERQGCASVLRITDCALSITDCALSITYCALSITYCKYRLLPTVLTERAQIVKWRRIRGSVEISVLNLDASSQLT